jgi:hypothetical protein
MSWNIEDRPNFYARTAGAIYLVVIVFGGFSEGFVASKLIVGGDAAATARNILASSALWSASLAGNLIVPLIAVPQLWIEYRLLRPVGRGLAQLFLLFNIVSLAVEAVSKLFQLVVLPILGGHGFGGAFTDAQLFGLARLALILHDEAFNVALMFFGCACLLSGWLIYRSTYLPKAVGVLMQIAGAAYLIATFSALFVPTLSDAISPWILLPPLIGESSLCLWLLVRGIDVDRWRARLGE